MYHTATVPSFTLGVCRCCFHAPHVGIALLPMTTLLSERLPHMQKGPGLIPGVAKERRGFIIKLFSKAAP